MVKVRFVDKEEIDKLDSNHLSFFNKNTEADLIIGKELAGEEDFTHDKC
jgi:hypothetical protein